MSKTIPNNGEPIIVAVDMVGRWIDGRYTVTYTKKRYPNDTNPEIITLYPDNLDDKIKIYKREVEGWFLEPARRLLKSAKSFNNSLIILMICMSYIEGVEQYKEGSSSNGQSSQFFINSINKLYPNECFSEDDIKNLYHDSRCGLFHNGMTRSRVVFNHDFEKALQFEDQRIKINPRKLLEDIRQDFKDYINLLEDRNNTIARQNFGRMFSII
jgi:hypothetical protein